MVTLFAAIEIYLRSSGTLCFHFQGRRLSQEACKLQAEWAEVRIRVYVRPLRERRTCEDAPVIMQRYEKQWQHCSVKDERLHILFAACFDSSSTLMMEAICFSERQINFDTLLIITSWKIEPFSSITRFRLFLLKLLYIYTYIHTSLNKKCI